MRLTQMLFKTLRNTPAEAEVVSHQLLVRAGFIRKVASGIYNLLPMMNRVVHKVSTIVREELDAAGAQELLMPILQPADLWQQSGRWEVYGKELMRLKDRHDRDCVLGPTHEEVITSLAGHEVESYRQLPVNLYQIQLKYRDEIRPRFGLLRGREFMMKDAYSFHASDECLEKEYQNMASAYTRIFDRCGLDTVMVRSDSGAIGGDVSHEFMVLTNIAEGEQESGENAVFFCDTCDYAANSDRAESGLSGVTDGGDYFPKVEERETPNCETIDDLCKLLGCPPSLICKSLLYIADDQPVLAMIRGDYDIEEIKLKNAIGCNELRLASAEEVKDITGASKGYVGPNSFSYTMGGGEKLLTKFNDNKILVIPDSSVGELSKFVIASNKIGFHTVGYHWDVVIIDNMEYSIGSYLKDIRLAKKGDGCPQCEGALDETRGIEVGNIFKLSTKYSEAMSATYTAEDGTEKHFIMGCYGIGITRTAAAAIERYHDQWGMMWPMAIAPYHAVVIPVNVNDEAQMHLAETVYAKLQEAGLEVVLDDRDERAGVKFNDADLVGYPMKITAGKKAAEGLLECKMRDWGKDAKDMTVDDAVAWAITQHQSHWKPSVGNNKVVVTA